VCVLLVCKCLTSVPWIEPGNIQHRAMSIFIKYLWMLEIV
jgi:hypothetical protein